MTVIDYVTEEVERQGHNTTTLDGIQRVGWMLNAWAYALDLAVLTPGRVVYIGQRVEPFTNKEGVRTANVRIRGDDSVRFAEWRKVPQLLENLVADINSAAAPASTSFSLEAYRRFIMIHPFLDGNGRTGKVLLNWLNGSLLDPIFPPDDFWGRPIRNP